MSEIIFKVGDCFLYKTNNKNKMIGKIEEIIQTSTEKIVRYNIFYFPEDTKEGRRCHNSVNEVYSSDQIEKELYSNLRQHVEVFTLEEYIKHKITSTTKTAKEVYFYRQKYSFEDNSYLPDLDSTCYCYKIYNPDEEYQQCAKCKDYFHMSCYIQSRRKKCYNELCNNIVEYQFTTLQLESEKNKLNEHTNKILGNKHKRDEEIINQSTNQKISHYSNYQLEKYRNLNEPSRINLVSLTEQIEKEHLIKSKSYSETDKVRQNAKDTILFVLLYGIEELKNMNDWNKFNQNDCGLNQTNINDEKIAVKYCEILSTEIENCIYSANKYEISNHYKKKLRTLYTYLTHEDNYKLRIAIISKEIKPKKLVGMSSDELAPSSFIQSRLEKQNKYFKEQVLIDETPNIITKTHKGEAILNIADNNKANAVSEFIPFEIVKSKINSEEVIDLNEDLIQDNNNINIDPDYQMKRYQTTENKLEKMIAIKYNTKSKAKIKYLASFEDYTKENLEKTINAQVQTDLKNETIQTLNQYRKKYRKDIKF